MRVLVCGSRTWTDKDLVFEVLDGLDRLCREDFLTVIEGGASGADRLAALWVHERENPGHECYPADWARHGRSAGPIRNQQMLEEGEPDLVVAFSEKPVTRGTADMILRATNAGIPTRIVSHD